MLTGCKRTETRIGDFTIITTRLVETNKITESARAGVTRGVVGEYYIEEDEAKDGQAEGGIKAAVDDALRKATGDVMLNCVVFYVNDKPNDRIGYKVVGDVMKTLGN